MFRPTTAKELEVFNNAPSWTEAFTAGCKHVEVHVYKDGTIECSNCGMCLPTDGKW